MFKNCFIKTTALMMVWLLSIYQKSLSQIKPTPADERMQGLEKKKMLEKKSLVNDIKFRNIGPSIMSGRVDDIDVNPNDPTEFYVAYATGGLWYTKNNGQSFKPVFDSENVIGIGDIAVDWKNNIIWLGSGEVNSSRSSYAGNGVYKSIDSGKTWTYCGLPESHHIGKIQLHPSNPDVAWVAVLGHLYSPNKERGVYKTTDGGKTWKQVLFVDENTGAVDMDANPQNANELYASVWYRTRRAWNFEPAGNTSAIYKSIDGGETWNKVSLAKNGFPESKDNGRIGVAVYPKNPQIVYAVIDNQEKLPDTTKKDTSGYKLDDFKTISKESFLALDNSKLDSFLKKNRVPSKYSATVLKEMIGSDKLKPTAVFDYLDTGDDGFSNTGIKGCEVYKSIDGGITWKKVNEKPIANYNTYGYYFGKIYVSPLNENKVWILGFYAMLSIDGGKTFNKIDKENVHPDHHALWVNPFKDSHIINGNDGGLNISYDDGEHWFKANTPAVGQFYAIAVDNARPYNVYGGLQDNGSWYGPSNHKENVEWHSEGEYTYKGLNGGDGMQVQVDTRDNNTVYSGYQFGAYARRTKNNSSSEVNLKPKHDMGEKPLRFNWQTPILLSTFNQDIFYYGANRLYRSFNKGEKPEAISGDLTNGRKEGNVPFGTLTSISESPLKLNIIYTGSDDGNIYISKDAGFTFTNISNSLPKKVQGLYVSRVVASKYKENVVYVCLNGYRNDHFNAYVFKSDDYGASWKQIANDLPAEPVNVLREDPKKDSILYVGTDGGLYVSIDMGNNFMAMNNGLPKSIPVHDIAIHTRENEIVLGTHGRSIYIAKLDNVQKLLSDEDFRKKQEEKLK